MKLWKHVLIALALLVGLVPCGHAFLHHDHDHLAAMEVCALSSIPCECHSCDHKACTPKTGEQRILPPVPATVEPPSSPAVLFVLPETAPAIRPSTPPVSGVLAILQTVQLLI